MTHSRPAPSQTTPAALAAKPEGEKASAGGEPVLTILEISEAGGFLPRLPLGTGAATVRWNLSGEETVEYVSESAMALLDAASRPRAALTTTASSGDRAEGVVAEIAAERRRQIEAEGWTPQHDDEHSGGEMATAAACYAYMSPLSERERRRIAREGAPYRWPWAASWWKPADARRDLVKAGALIVAEIERLDRAAPAALVDEEAGS